MGDSLKLVFLWNTGCSLLHELETPEQCALTLNGLLGLGYSH
jgi:hypothetical protein